MPTLHDLFDAASDGLPPLPDLAPSARQIARRRQLATRTTAAVLGSALVVGAGTFVVSAQHPSSVVNNASAPHTFDSQYVLSVLRSLWPVHNEQLELDSGYAIVIKEGNHEVGRLFFAVYPDVNKFPGLLGCEQGSSADTCVTATSGDGDLVLAETIEEALLTSLPAATSPATGSATSRAAQSPVSHSSFPGEKTPARPGGMQRAFRLHGTYLGQLTLSGTAEGLPTKQQMLTLVESPAYEQLIESAVAGSSFEWFGTPPAGVPSYTYGPSPSDSSGSAAHGSLPPPGSGH